MKTKSPMMLDSAETIFFNRELEVVKAASYDVKHKPLKAFTLIPVSTEANRGASTITYRVYDMVGVAKIIADYATDFPRVDAYGTEVTVKCKGIGDSYGYSIEEIRQSEMAQKGLDVRRARAARRAIEEKLDSIAWEGDSATNLKGLINYPGISEYTIPADGTGSSKLWTTKSADLIVRDAAGQFNYIVNSTNGMEVPDTWIMPLTNYTYISTKRMGDGSDETVLSYIKRVIPALTTITWVNELAGKGSGTTSYSLMYTKDADHLTFEMPQPFEQFEAEKHGMEYTIPCHAKTAGVIVYYTASVCFAYGF